MPALISGSEPVFGSCVEIHQKSAGTSRSAGSWKTRNRSLRLAIRSAAKASSTRPTKPPIS